MEVEFADAAECGEGCEEGVAKADRGGRHLSGSWELWLGVVLDVLQGSFNNLVDDDHDDHGLLWRPRLNWEGTQPYFALTLQTAGPLLHATVTVYLNVQERARHKAHSEDQHSRLRSCDWTQLDSHRRSLNDGSGIPTLRRLMSRNSIRFLDLHGV